jgi:hypothetical protein
MTRFGVLFALLGLFFFGVVFFAGNFFLMVTFLCIGNPSFSIFNKSLGHNPKGLVASSVLVYRVSRHW